MSKIFNILIPFILMISRGEKIIYPDNITPLSVYQELTVRMGIKQKLTPVADLN